MKQIMLVALLVAGTVFGADLEFGCNVYGDPGRTLGTEKAKFEVLSGEAGKTVVVQRNGRSELRLSCSAGMDATTNFRCSFSVWENGRMTSASSSAAQVAARNGAILGGFLYSTNFGGHRYEARCFRD